MKKSSLFKDNRWLWIPYLLILMLSVFFLVNYSKTDIHIRINQMHSPFADVFFKYASYMGEGWVLVPFCVLLLFVRFRYALMAIASSLIAPLITQFFKRIVWPVSPRPKVVFEHLYDLHVVEGVHLHSSYSFPSGHATGAFALFVVLALIVKKPVWKIVFLALAILTAYSRIYLSQHFLIDVTVGSVIGTATAFLCYVWLSRYKSPWLDKSFKIVLK